MAQLRALKVGFMQAVYFGLEKQVKQVLEQYGDHFTERDMSLAAGEILYGYKHNHPETHKRNWEQEQKRKPEDKKQNWSVTEWQKHFWKKASGYLHTTSALRNMLHDLNMGTPPQEKTDTTGFLPDEATFTNAYTGLWDVLAQSGYKTSREDFAHAVRHLKQDDPLRRTISEKFFAQHQWTTTRPQPGNKGEEWAPSLLAA